MKLFLFFFFSLVLIYETHSQAAEKIHSTLSLGLNYGQSSQNRFPLNNPDYLYNTEYLKIQINYLLRKTRFSYELNIEPSLYLSEHQLLNQYFIQPNRGPDYLEQREKFTQKRSFMEYAVNVGIMMRYEILANFSTYILGSIGPMISTQDTERLSKGFSFSDIFGLGVSYRQKKLLLDLRLTLRHNSNLGLLFPNNGHNSIGVESGISFQLR